MFLYQQLIQKIQNTRMRLTDKSGLRHKKMRIKKGIQQTKEWETSIKRAQYDYLVTHHEITTQYHNREYKNACDLAFYLEQPHQKYLNLYYQDQLTSVNKVFKCLILRNQLNVDTTKDYFERGEEVLGKFYERFIKDEAITSNLKAVNTEMKTKITRFLMVALCFITKAAFVKSAQSKPHQAKKLFQISYDMCTNITTSSTSNYKLLKKASDCLLCYSAFLIDTKEIDKAIQVLFAVLRNETNIAIILSYRLKNKQKSEAKNIKAQLYNRLYAALFNLAQCYQTKKLLHHSYFFLRECELISHLKNQAAQKEIRSHLASFIRSLHQSYLQHQELDIILSAYFKPSQIDSSVVELKVCPYPLKNPEAAKSEKSIFVKGNSHKEIPKSKNCVKRSISLQDKLNQLNAKKIIKQFGQEILFFGVNLFDKKKSNPKNNTTHVKFRETNQSQRIGLSKAYLATQIQNKEIQESKKESKLKKKGKLLKNTEFRAVKQPIQYQVLQKRIQNMWKQQQLQANKTKQKMYLLRYKSQYLNYKQIAKQNKNLFEQIQVCTNKQPVYRDSTKAVSKKEEETETGINLFKKILLKHIKKFSIKKSQTIYILKKTSNPTNHHQQSGKSYCVANESINFLLQKLKRQKDSYGATPQNRQSNYAEYDYGYLQRSKSKVNVSNVFLTKDTVQMPNLFISYITSQALNTDILSAILQYGIQLLKHKQ